MKNPLVVNRWITPDGTTLHSRSWHDYVEHLDKDGKVYFVDGGTEYIRSSSTGLTWAGYYENDNFGDIRQVWDWASYGKNGKEPKKYILLKDLSEDHIHAILQTQQQIKGTSSERLLLKELQFRKDRND